MPAYVRFRLQIKLKVGIWIPESSMAHRVAGFQGCVSKCPVPLTLLKAPQVGARSRLWAGISSPATFPEVPTAVDSPASQMLWPGVRVPPHAAMASAPREPDRPPANNDCSPVALLLLSPTGTWSMTGRGVRLHSRNWKSLSQCGQDQLAASSVNTIAQGALVCPVLGRCGAWGCWNKVRCGGGCPPEQTSATCKRTWNGVTRAVRLECI
jgi:hypothetical protein